MRASACRKAVIWGAVAVGAAEAASRLLSPRTPVIRPLAVDVTDHFTPAEIDRGRAYARPQLAIALASSGLELGALALLALRPPPPLRARWRSPVAGGATVAVALSTLLAFVPMPLAAVARRRSMAYGLDTQGWASWGVDRLKAGAIGSAMAAGAGAAVVGLMQRWPRRWWLPAAGGSIGLGAALAALAPVLLDPVFNHFEPLPEGQTRSDVLELAAAAGVKVHEVYSVDASRRTTAANAYVTGLGPTKRIVLFDTLLDRYDSDQVRLVVAHELAHVAHRDVLRQVAYAALVAPALGLAVQRTLEELGPRAAAEPELLPGRLPALALAAALMSAPAGLVAGRLSRAVERRADQFSLQLAGAPEAFVAFERAIALQNVADLDPPRWVKRLLASHPPTTERIGAALAFAAQAA